MRLIDADAFDEVLQNAQTECKKSGGNFRYGVLSNVRANLAKMPTVDGWVSVKDMLPDNANHPGGFCPRYLVYTDYGITEGWYNPDEGCWFGYLSYMTRVYEEWNIDLERGTIPKTVKNIPVKYWMPFPELPKEEDDGTEQHMP